MAVYSNGDIRGLIETGGLSITPFVEAQPASIDLHVGRFGLLLMDDFTEPVSMDTTPVYEEVDLQNGFELRSTYTLLVPTQEHVMLGRDVCGVVKGRSGAGRRGLQVAFGANWIDPGFEGRISLMLGSKHRFNIKEGDSVAQLVLLETTSAVQRSYGVAGNKYQGGGVRAASAEQEEK